MRHTNKFDVLNTRFKYITLALGIGIISSCKKELPYAEVGSTDISITILSPTPQETVTIDEGMHVDGIVDANAKMGGWRVTIERKSTHELVDQYTDIYEQTQYIVHHHWFPTYSDTGQYIVIVDALSRELSVLDSESIKIKVQL